MYLPFFPTLCSFVLEYGDLFWSRSRVTPVSMWRGQVNDSRANYEFQSFKCAIRLCPVCADLCPSMAICFGPVHELRRFQCRAAKQTTAAPTTNFKASNLPFDC